jgi:predicted LPLAT superfamily acyltransferase
LPPQPGFQKNNRKKIAIDCRNDDGPFVLGMSTCGNIAMIYALPCRHSEAIICALNEQEEAAVTARVMGALWVMGA